MPEGDAPSQALDRSRVFSPSKLDTYKNCPRQYRFRYIDRLPVTGTSVEAWVGVCVHKAFEELYSARQHGRLLSEDEVLAVYEREWSCGARGPVKLRDPRYTLEDWRATGAGCVQTYYRLHAPFDRDKTVAVERRLGFRLPLQDAGSGKEEELRIEGLIDRLSLAPDGCFEIHDYKTGAALPTQAQKDADWQLAIYQLAVLDAWPDAPGARLVWHYVRHGKTLVSTRTPEQLAALRQEIAALIHTLRSDRAFEPVKSPLCDWCDYREACPLFKHAEAFAKLPEDERRHESGVQLADALGALDARKRSLREESEALSAEEEALKSRILTYADAHDVRAIQGTEGEVDIHIHEELKFPTRGASPERVERMEAELRGTPIWPEVSRLDPKGAVEAYREGRPGPEWRDRLKAWIDRWARPETVRTVRFKRRRGPSE